jgi:hypothetical protein
MISLVELLNEIKASKYIETIRLLLTKIDWDNASEFVPIKEESLRVIDRIENIHNYEGESAVKYLEEAKLQAKDVVYILNNILENQNE